MRIGWVGFHVEGVSPLAAVLQDGYPVEAMITLGPDGAARRSGVVDYGPLCKKYGVPLFEVDNINSKESADLFRRLSLDIVFVIGWSQIVRPPVLSLARIGMIGAHASLLPHNRGRAPINWVLINGEAETGNSLMWLAESVDGGDLIDQTVIPITVYDTCASLYDRVAESNKDMILRVLPKRLKGERPGRKQPHVDEPLLPGRRAADGLIDWSTSALDVYNFVRALTRPYPGAFNDLNGERWTIWRCALLPGSSYAGIDAGQIVGPMVSPVDKACGQVVACGEGAVVLLELESENGTILKGRTLSDQQWKGRVWASE